jgi:hypothetical protein
MFPFATTCEPDHYDLYRDQELVLHNRLPKVKRRQTLLPVVQVPGTGIGFQRTCLTGLQKKNGMRSGPIEELYL